MSLYAKRMERGRFLADATTHVATAGGRLIAVILIDGTTGSPDRCDRIRKTCETLVRPS
ncbi:hypothetical protein [Bradyrhizobium frederickii]|uniref:hypothetical protein n=1 Tax=Bradyrhizobium frederickii TaxID=2560054 RepID=UPI00142F69FA|nr:hypothetical protein [Bradyrhizobium frederickii]